MNRSVRLLVSLVTALALSVGGASAQVEDLQVPGAVVGTDDLGMESEAAVRRPLGIEEAVALSLANNLEVEVERFAPLIAGTEEQGA
ncbi:MAG: hypothetical protein ACX98W_20730, partial [bacterium]